MRARPFSFFLWIATWLGCIAMPAHASDEKRSDPIALPYTLHLLKNPEATRLGQDAASADFAASRYRALCYGQMTGLTEEEEKLEKLGVRFESIAGCLVSESIRSFTQGYNVTMESLLQEKFGPDLFKGTKADPR